MIEMLTPVAVAYCGNCPHPITCWRSDLRVKSFWTHDDTGSEACPGRVAEPEAGTYRPVDTSQGDPS